MYLQSSCTVWEKWKCSIPQIVFHQPAKECPPPLHIPRMDIFVNNQLKHTIKKWTGMQNNVVQPNVNEVKQCQSTRTMPQSQQKKSFIFFHITVIQCPAVASIHDYISTKGGGGWGGGRRGQCMIVAFFFKRRRKKRREEIRIIKKD